jgi:hypothetical protein
VTGDIPEVKHLKPHQLGWLRRREMENEKRPDIEVWEQPNGQLYMHDRKGGPLMLVKYANPPRK